MGMFGKKLDAERLFEAASSGLDKLFFTKEEKSEAAKALADAQLEFVKLSVNENSIRSITRRYLAIAIVSVFLVLILAAVVSYAYDREYAAFIFRVAEHMNTLVMMVAGFFFGAYMLGSHLLNKGKIKK